MPLALIANVAVSPAAVFTFSGCEVMMIVCLIVIVAADESVEMPPASVTRQNTCIPFQLSLAVPDVDAVVWLFHLLQPVAPTFLKYH